MQCIVFCNVVTIVPLPGIIPCIVPSVLLHSTHICNVLTSRDEFKISISNLTESFYEAVTYNQGYGLGMGMDPDPQRWRGLALLLLQQMCFYRVQVNLERLWLMVGKEVYGGKPIPSCLAMFWCLWGSDTENMKDLSCICLTPAAWGPGR